MNYYEVALKGFYLEALSYESKAELEIYSEVIVELAKKGRVQGFVMKRVQKPNFATKPILEATGRFLSKSQSELSLFISSYYTCKIGFVLSGFEASKPYETSSVLIKNAPKLSEKQLKALEFAKNNDTSLLFADTGSGKTEIYISLIKEYLAKGQQCLLLMPEIALTPQMQKRLSAYFEDKFIMWHSKISKAKKQKALQSLENGEILLVAGARSALFLPFFKLALIIVDEEHDNSYKANDNPRINARDLALFLGQRLKIKVLLGSATPSVTSFYRQKSFRLKGTFFQSKKNFIYDESELGLSSTVLRELRVSLRAKKQAIIFLPTRANFRQILCQGCGKTINCPFCSVAMSLHKDKAALKCHYCGFLGEIAKSCPHCEALMLEARKMGTSELCELLQTELSTEFKDIKIAKFDSDTTTTQKKLEAILQDFNEHKIDILVGTSMLAKGHDYHSVDLSVILGLDEYLFRPNFRAYEESLALAMQVAGRAGRKGAARVLIQSKQKGFWQRYIENYDAFLRDELRNRKGLYPPFSRLLRLVIEDKDKEKASKLCQKLGAEFKELKSIEVVGFGACGIEFMQNKFRFYVLLRSKTHTPLIKAAFYASQFKEIIADIDPIEFN
ncbi:primosomal protein N' [Campylobacter troglodytis]|uniref:primosomal protein N' n=1 Tax=Campylobacter troglodytis TaxID=654363 RepID=UPI0011572187|nr:primosomal protein N' [Campylobacter troglodytis]TQR61356.1 primosomal protein N' [Campylobacter troglodytis]